MPGPKAIYGRRVWDKFALDDAFDVLDGGHRKDDGRQVFYEFEA
jgi:hypothetical protein